MNRLYLWESPEEPHPVEVRVSRLDGEFPIELTVRETVQTQDGDHLVVLSVPETISLQDMLESAILRAGGFINGAIACPGPGKEEQNNG